MNEKRYFVITDGPNYPQEFIVILNTDDYSEALRAFDGYVLLNRPDSFCAIGDRIAQAKEPLNWAAYALINPDYAYHHVDEHEVEEGNLKGVTGWRAENPE